MKRQANTVAALEKLLSDAKSGKLTGAVFATKHSNWHRAIYAIGDYASKPDEAAHIVYDMANALSGIVERRQGLGVIYRMVYNLTTGEIALPFVTDASKRVLGICPAELQRDPKHFERMLHPDDLERLWDYTEGMASTGGMWEQPFRIISGSRIVPVIGRAELTILPNGNRQFDGLIMEHGSKTGT